MWDPPLNPDHYTFALWNCAASSTVLSKTEPDSFTALCTVTGGCTIVCCCVFHNLNSIFKDFGGFPSMMWSNITVKAIKTTKHSQWQESQLEAKGLSTYLRATDLLTKITPKKLCRQGDKDRKTHAPANITDRRNERNSDWSTKPRHADVRSPLTHKQGDKK